MNESVKENQFVVLIHGGAGVIVYNDEQAEKYFLALESHVKAIYEYFLHKTKSNSPFTSVDVVEFGVKLLEDDKLFNAGCGSVYTEKEEHELEASIMDGETLKCGAVSLIQTIRNPISAARLVMDHTKHNYLIGDNVLLLAQKYGLEIVEKSYFDSSLRLEQLNKAKKTQSTCLDHNLKTSSESNKKMGTVGCVCLWRGSLAAATSTGGMTNKLSGRIGDSPIIGAGTYANNQTCAVSCTGIGEEFMRHVAAYDISCRMKYGHNTLEDAVHGTVFDHLPEGSGGVIAVDAQGNACMSFNTPGMFRGMLCIPSLSDSAAFGKIGIWKEERFVSL